MQKLDKAYATEMCMPILEYNDHGKSWRNKHSILNK